MKYLVPLLLLVMIVADVYQLNMSLGPGLSVKNAVLYVAAMVIALRIVVQGRIKWALPRLHGAFAVLIGYACMSVIVLTLLVKSPDYHVLRGVIALKSNLIDQFLFFAVCFYGTQNKGEALGVLRILYLIVAASSAITVGNATGLFQIGAMEIAESGRVEGALGEPNQYAAFLVTMLPPLVAALVTSHKPGAKLFWLVSIVLSLVAMVMTVSRGGFLALLVAGVWGTYMFRNYLPMRRVAVAAALGVFALIVFLAASGQYGELLHERVIGQTFGSSGDASSGRSDIWETAFTRMMESPWTLITGFGWFAYESMAFRFATHNAYLLFWFNLGLIGLLAFITVLAQLFGTARKAIKVAGPDARPHLIGLVVGLIGLSVAIFFVNLFNPWPYIWTLAGLCMRIAVSELSTARAQPQAVAASAPTRVAAGSQRRRPAWQRPQDSPAR